MHDAYGGTCALVPLQHKLSALYEESGCTMEQLNESAESLLSNSFAQKMLHAVVGPLCDSDCKSARQMSLCLAPRLLDPRVLSSCSPSLAVGQ